MAHFAKVVDGIVEQVVVAEQDFIDTQEGTWVQTSYNTRQGVHYRYEEKTLISLDYEGNEVTDVHPAWPVPSGQDGLRKNFAGTGYIYDSVRDAFYPPQPYPSWTLNEDTCWWEAPVSKPDEGNPYEWNEDTLSWDSVELPTP